VREGVDLGKVAWALGEAKRRGLRRAGVIAQREAAGLGLDAGFCRRYLSDILHFDLGPRERAGLHHYYTLASELGLAPARAWRCATTTPPPSPPSEVGP